MGKASILIIEDDPDIRELLEFSVAREGWEPRAAPSGELGLELARAAAPDLVLLDIMLPGMDGLETLRSLKADARLAQVPVILASARGEDADVVAGLELGAEDYVIKPFSPRVLVARIRTALRRRAAQSAPDAQTVLRSDGIEVDTARHEALVDGRRADLSATEFSILSLFLSNPGRVYARASIIDAVKGPDYPVTDRSVDVQIVALRRKLGDQGARIETVRGVGYRFKDQRA